MTNVLIATLFKTYKHINYLSIQGQIMEPNHLQQHLRNVMLVFGPNLTRVRTEQRQRTEARSLREEQDRAYVE